MKELTKDKLNVKIFDTRSEMGFAAARMVGEKIRELLQEREYVSIIFASAPSQNEFLTAFQEMEVDWSKINAFHMDEYVGLDKNSPQGFGNFLKERLFSKVPLREIHYLDGNSDDLEEECDRYAQLLKKYPTDIVCLGIGENTHLAFNDPHVALFNDSEIVKVVELDEKCRFQQVNDGCFATIEEVPVNALTITIPALFKSTYAYAVVPGELKASAIYHTLNNEIVEKYPSTILRKHPNAVLFIDINSAKKI
jgi:glucosamine-6-phosphate deaminase